MTSRSCFLTTASSCEKAHVIDKGEGLQNFIKAYTLIYGEEPPQGSEDVQNVLYVREDYHRDYMDSRTMPQDLKQRRIGFDFINKECIIEDRDSHEIIIKPWKYVRRQACVLRVVELHVHSEVDQDDEAKDSRCD